MNTVTRTITTTYSLMETPPRCRKPRPIEHTDTLTVDVPNLTSDQAPIAFTIDAPDYDRLPHTIRLHGSRLYAPNADCDGNPRPADDPDFLSLHVHHYVVDSAEEHFAELREQCGSLVVINGHVWTPIGEPRYEVHTPTFRDYCLLGVTTRPRNGGVAPWEVFRADDRDGALAYARQHGQANTTRGLINADSSPTITVHIPEAVTLSTIPQTPRQVLDLRNDYDSAVRALNSDKHHSPAREAELFATVARIRQSILDLGHPPVADPDAEPHENR